jgi:hypothetical protein
MTDRKRSRTARERPGETPRAQTRDGDEAERILGRAVARGLPIVCVVVAVFVGWIASVGSAVLVLASGALLGTIALLWASVRTLTGDAPLPTDLEALAAQNRDVDMLAEQKRRVLLALKDLQREHAIGKIDDADYEEIATKYREEAKSVMREMDHNAAPAHAEAERLALEYLAAHGLGANAGSASAAKAAPAGAGEHVRLTCTGCGTTNEPDAAFCKKCGSALTAAKVRSTDDNDATT